MQVKSIAEYSAILLTFIKLPFVIKVFVLCIFELPFYTGFTVCFDFFSVTELETLLMSVHEKQHKVSKPLKFKVSCVFFNPLYTGNP